MTKFEYAFNFMIPHEKGYVNHKNDPGGATNFGISLRFLDSIGFDVNNDSVVNVQDIKDLTLEIAKEIYQEEWWDRYKYEHIVDARLAAKIFDSSIWLGPSRAHSIAQIAINRTTGITLNVDGQIGPKTFQALNSSNTDALLNEIVINLQHFIINLVANHSKFKDFKKGWLNRTCQLPKNQL